MKIFLIRHGESTSDIEDRYGGQYDDHLTAKGIRQARKTAKKLSDRHIEIIFSSPFYRTKETSKILQKEWKCRVKIIGNIKERDRYAHLTGMKKTIAAKRHPEHVAKLKNYIHNVKGGENYEIFKDRMKKAFQELISSPHDTIAIVCHGGLIGCVFREILELGEFKYIGKCAYFEIEKKNGALKVLHMENAELEK